MLKFPHLRLRHRLLQLRRGLLRGRQMSGVCGATENLRSKQKSWDVV